MRSLAGILALFLGITCASPAQTTSTVSDIGNDKLDKTVTVRGTVDSFVASRSEGAPNSFFLKDATGSIRVAIWPDVFNEIPGKERIARGAVLTVTAVVSDFRGKLELHPKQPGDVLIESSSTTVVSSQMTTAPKKLADRQIGDTIVVAGVVDSFTPSRSQTAPASFHVRQAGEHVRIVIWPNTFQSVANWDKMAKGVEVTVEGKVAEYHGAREVHVDDASAVKLELRPVSSGPAALSPIAGLTRDKIKQLFTVVGTVISARRPSTDTAPFVLKVADADVSIDVVFWMQTADQLTTDQKARKGDRIRVTGELGEHRGTLQLRVEDPNNIATQRSHPELFRDTAETTSAAPAAAKPAPMARLADVQLAAAGERIRVDGEVRAIDSLQAGRRILLQDNSGTATLLLWDTAHGLKPQVRNLTISDRLSVTAVIANSGTSGTKVLVTKRPEDILGLSLGSH